MRFLCGSTFKNLERRVCCFNNWNDAKRSFIFFELYLDDLLFYATKCSIIFLLFLPIDWKQNENTRPVLSGFLWECEFFLLFG